MKQEPLRVTLSLPHVTIQASCKLRLLLALTKVSKTLQGGSKTLKGGITMVVLYGWVSTHEHRRSENVMNK